MSPPVVSVVICAYTEDRWDQLGASVASVLRQDRAPDDIVVVIDHNDALLARSTAELPGVRVVANDRAQGLSGARNTGIADTSGDIVCFLDDDATADWQWLSRLLAAYDEDRVLGVGGSAVPVWETSAPTWWPPEFGWVVGCSYPGLPETLGEVRNLMGCNMSLRRAVLDATGGFVEGLGRTGADGHGCEETELCIRARALFPGGRFLYEPRAVVHHFVPSTRGSWRYFADRCRAEGASKARVAGSVGTTSALAAERAYVRRVLPAAVAADLGRTLRGEPAGIGRAGAIVAGLALTAGSFALSRRSAHGLVGHRERPVPDGGADACADRSVPTSDGASADPLADATVVIATRERPDRLAQCLNSVLAGSILPRRVVVVDNAPTTDRTAVLVRQWAAREPRLRYVREDRPGLARAHNAGLPHVRTPLVAFTDDDVLVDTGWLEGLVRGFDGDDRVACVTGMIKARELDTLPQRWVEGHGGYGKGTLRRVFDADANRPDDPLFPLAAGRLGSGANMAFRTDYLRHRGGFDVALGTGTLAMGGDDLAAFYDVITSGHRLVYEPGALVLHQHHREYSALRRQTYGYGVGLGAHLTRSVLDDPRVVLRLVRNVGRAGRRAKGIVRPDAVPGLPPYPRDLSGQQLRGVVAGPWRYLRSRRRTRREVL